MLNNKQVKYLTQIAKLETISWSDDLVFNIKLPPSNDFIQIPYDEFKLNMELSDLRHYFLLGENNFIAGGSVLAWVSQENKNQDTDFYFLNEDSLNTFVYFLESLGVVKTKDTGYAISLFDKETKAILQAVKDCYNDINVALSSFDIEVCKFAVSSDYVIFTRNSIYDLISMSLSLTPNIKENYRQMRITKYIRKGYFPNFKHKGTTKDYDW